jgi:hypothetical protein
MLLYSSSLPQEKSLTKLLVLVMFAEFFGHSVFSVFSSHASLQEHFSTWLTLTLKLRHSQMSQRSLVGHGFDQQACPVQKFFLAACEKHPFLGVDLGF